MSGANFRTDEAAIDSARVPFEILGKRNGSQYVGRADRCGFGRCRWSVLKEDSASRASGVRNLRDSFGFQFSTLSAFGQLENAGENRHKFSEFRNVTSHDWIERVAAKLQLQIRQPRDEELLGFWIKSEFDRILPT